MSDYLKEKRSDATAADMHAKWGEPLISARAILYPEAEETKVMQDFVG